MTDEEKKALEDIKNIVDDLEDTEQGAIIALQQDEIDSLKIIAELIDKQQKEIEKYKKVIDNREFTWKQKYEETFEYVKDNFIKKDKIRNLLKQVNASLYHFKDSEKNNIMQRIKDRLEQLLEE